MIGTSGPYALVGDIGGTNTRVALASGDKLLPDSVRRFQNADHDGLSTVLTRYLSELGNPECRSACVAVAGPVRKGLGQLTNLDWTIDESTLAEATGAARSLVLNDLQAQGFALDRIAPEKLRKILPGNSDPEEQTRLVVGIGTGFNATPVFDSGAGRISAAAEAGHQTMPVRTEADGRLMRYIEENFGFPSVEEVLSGRGVEQIYQWVASEAGCASVKSAANIMAAVGDGEENARRTATVFVHLLGGVLGNLALNFLPFGGIFLVGGVARAFAEHMPRMGFREAFRDKGRFAEFLDGFPVLIVEDDFAALSGAATHLSYLEKISK